MNVLIPMPLSSCQLMHVFLFSPLQPDGISDYSQIKEILYFPVSSERGLSFNEIGAFCLDSVCLFPNRFTFPTAFFYYMLGSMTVSRSSERVCLTGGYRSSEASALLLYENMVDEAEQCMSNFFLVSIKHTRLAAKRRGKTPDGPITSSLPLRSITCPEHQLPLNTSC